MQTLNQISYNIAEIVDKIDNYSVIERIKKLIIQYRALFVRRSFTNRPYISSNFTQIIVLETKLYDSAGIATIDLENYITRTKDSIPDFVNLHNDDAIIYAGGIDMKTPFTRIDPREWDLLEYNKFSYSIIRYFLKNNYLYIPNAKPKHIIVEAVFEDPTDLSGYTSLDGTMAYNGDDAEFPMSEDMTSLVISAILSNEFKVDQSENKEIQINDKSRGT